MGERGARRRGIMFASGATERNMISIGGGGGGGLPRIDGPVELMILLVVVGGIVWVGYRLFSD